MPSGGNNIFDAERFATLVGRFDLGNPSEAEAINAARVIRRTLAEHNLRFVDAMGRADVMQALDTQFQAVREDSEELKTALRKSRNTPNSQHGMRKRSRTCVGG